MSNGGEGDILNAIFGEVLKKRSIPELTSLE